MHTCICPSVIVFVLDLCRANAGRVRIPWDFLLIFVLYGFMWSAASPTPPVLLLCLKYMISLWCFMHISTFIHLRRFRMTVDCVKKTCNVHAVTVVYSWFNIFILELLPSCLWTVIRNPLYFLRQFSYLRFYAFSFYFVSSFSLLRVLISFSASNFCRLFSLAQRLELELLAFM